MGCCKFIYFCTFHFQSCIPCLFRILYANRCNLDYYVFILNLVYLNLQENPSSSTWSVVHLFNLIPKWPSPEFADLYSVEEWFVLLQNMCDRTLVRNFLHRNKARTQLDSYNYPSFLPFQSAYCFFFVYGKAERRRWKMVTVWCSFVECS